MTKTVRNIFLLVFILSTIFVYGLLMMSSTISYAPAAGSSTEVPAPTPGPDGTIIENEKPSAFSSNFALVGTLATSLASLIGFITTTLITWRKEKREAALADIERKKLELELEKSRLELEELKKQKKKVRE